MINPVDRVEDLEILKNKSRAINIRSSNLLLKDKGKKKKLLKIAHRGGAGLKLENTLEAFVNSFNYNIDGIELDIHQTVDNQIVVYHDDNLSRLTSPQDNSYISQVTLSYLQQLKLKDGSSILTLKEVLTELKTLKFKLQDNINNTKFNSKDKEVIKKKLNILIEIKQQYNTSTNIYDSYPKIANRVIDIINEVFPFYKTKEDQQIFKIRLISFDTIVLPLIKDITPKFKTTLLLEDLNSNDIINNNNNNKDYNIVKLCQSLRCDAVSFDKELFLSYKEEKELKIKTLKAFITLFHHNKLRVGVYTVNDTEDMLFFKDLGIDTITTDHPDKLEGI